VAKPPPLAYATPEDAAFAQRFLSTHPQCEATWAKVVESVQTIGELQLTASKSRVAILGRTRFLWCNAANQDGSIVVRFHMPYRVEGDRVHHDEEGDRFSIRVKLASPADVDAEARGWFREACQWDLRGK